MLLLDEEKLAGISDSKRIEILLQWLKQLPHTIQTTSREQLKKNQQTLVIQLHKLLTRSLPPSLRSLLSSSYVSLYYVGDSSSLFETINKCNDVVKSKDETTANKMTALQCIGDLYRQHGRMAGSLFLDVIQTLLKAIKSSEYRGDIFHCMESILCGLGTSALSAHKDIYKCIKNGLTDKHTSVRSAAAKCALELSKHSSFLYCQELDSVSQACLKSFEGSTYHVRCSVACLLGSLLALTQKPLPAYDKGKVKLPSLDDVLSILSNGFIRGGGGFLKTGGPELLKGGIANRDVRVGVTQAYVFFLSELGGVWLERHLPLILRHILDLLTHSKTTSTHIDAVYSRKCIGFIIKSVFNRLLGESAQLAATKHLCSLIIQYTNHTLSNGLSNELGDEGEKSGEVGGGSDKVVDKNSRQHVLVCALIEISSLILSLNTAALSLLVSDNEIMDGDNPSPLIEAISNALVHPSLAARLSGAGCIHCVGSSLPSLITPLIDHLVKGLKVNRGNSDGLVGYSYALASLLSTVQFSELGVPSAKAQEVFLFGMELIKTPANGGKLSIASVQSGWALIGAYLSLGPAYVRSNLRNILTLWHGVFPHSRQQLTAEMKTGTSSSWKHTLETRVGALTSIVEFISSCQSLLSPAVTKTLMLPLDSALAMTSGLAGLVKAHGVHLKGAGAMLRLRLYQGLLPLSGNAYESCLNTLLRELVAEFTLSDNMASTTTSLLRSMCHKDDSILLGSWLEETDHRDVEEMLQPNSAAGSGALEHDPSSIYLYANKYATLPGPLPLGVAVIDASISLFGRVFPQVSSKHRQQLLTHFKECIKQAKPSNRQLAIQINIFTAFLAGLKGLIDSKSSLGDDDLISTAYTLITGAMSSPEPMLRCAAGEALGRLSQVVGEAGFVAQIVQMSVDTLKSSKDINTRTGHLLSLGCLHRYVGGMGSGQHLQITVTTLQELASDSDEQVWALHALGLIADSGGPLFRNHVDSTLSLLLSLLINTPRVHTQMYRCLGTCLSALLTTLGPELQIMTKSMSSMRETCLTCYAIIQGHPDSVVQSAAISCLQQLQLFAPSLVSLEGVVPDLYLSLNSSHLLLRRTVANCLRQFSQQEPRRIWEMLWKDGKGLEHTVLSKLDIETDEKLRFDLKEIVFSLLSSLAPNDPMKWLLLCNGVLSATGQTDDISKDSEDIGQTEGTSGVDVDEDMKSFTSGEEKQVHTNITPRWPTKVFAVECSRKIYKVCKNNPAHFDLVLAQKIQRQDGGDYLVMHLSELVRTSFIAATASVDQLKLAGYKALQDVIELFAGTPDPDYPQHVLLEQYQAQIGAALRPAFTSDTPPHVTAMACQVCSEWLGSGVSRDPSDLKRVQQLLVSSLKKLRKEQTTPSVYGEAVATMESLAVLKAWAELYIKVSQDDTDNSDLVSPHLPLLSHYWLAALRDNAYLSLPAQFNTQLPSSGGTFYTPSMIGFVKSYYESNWSSLLHAAAIWVNRTKLNETYKQEESVAVPAFAAMVPLTPSIAPPTDERHDTFHLILGLAIQALCNPSIYDSTHDVQCCLYTLHELINTSLARTIFSNENQYVIEVLNLLHRVLLTSPANNLCLLTLKIAISIAKCLETSEKSHINGGISHTLLVVAACYLFKFIPRLSDQVPSIRSPVHEEMIAVSVSLLPIVLSLHETQDDILPSLLYLTLSAIQYLSTSSSQLTKTLQTFKLLCTNTPNTPMTSSILHSTLMSLLISNGNTSFTDIPSHTRLLLVSMVLLSPVSLPPDNIIKEWYDFCSKCLLDNDTKVQMTALQVCETLFTCTKTDLAVHCIHSLAPDVIVIIQKWIKKEPVDSNIVIRATQVVEVLLKQTPDIKKSSMMGLILPLFISTLINPSQTCTQQQRNVHDHVLNTLIKMGSSYQQAFKSAMTTSPHLKTRLEMAIKGSKDASKPVSKTGQTSKQPTIKLKMDFSNFK